MTQHDQGTAMHTTRRTLLKGTLATAVAATAATVTRQGIVEAAAVAPQQATGPNISMVGVDVGPSHALALSTGSGLTRYGLVHTASGGAPFGIVKNGTAGTRSVQGNNFDDIVVATNLQAPQPFFTSLSQSLAGKVSAQSGRIATYYWDSGTIRLMKFSGGIISQIVFPALSVSSNDNADIQATYTRVTTSQLSPATTPMGAYTGLLLSPAYFSLNIGQMFMKSASTVEDLTVKITPPTATLPAQFQYSDLAFTVAQDSNEANWLQTWFNNVVLGTSQAGPTGPQDGVLEYQNIDSGGKLQTLLTLKLGAMWIYRLDSVAEGVLKARAIINSMSASFVPGVGSV